MRVEINDYIVMDTEVCHGKPTFKGTEQWFGRFWKCLSPDIKLRTF